MSETVIEVEHVKKKYKLGEIGGGTLRGDLQSWWARMRHKEDPNLMIGTDTSDFGKEFYALDDINITINKGEAVGIIGHNGAGKSTLLKLLSRVTAPTDGRIRLKGRITSMLEVGTGFHQELTGRENIYMNGAILGMTKKEVDSKIEEIIDFSECRQFIDTPVKRYSSGMYVKLAFAVAAHLDSDILVMDEVLAVGDMKFQKKCIGKMGKEARNGKTVLYVSHNMATIRQLCNRCIVLNHGKVIFDGDVEKAIALYMDNSEYDFKSKYDFRDTKRFDGNNGFVKLEELEILNDLPLAHREKMRMKLKWKVESDLVERFRIRFIIHDRMTEFVIGAVHTRDMTPDEPCEQAYEFDTSDLAPGDYSVIVNVVNYDNGKQTSYDAFWAFGFEVSEESQGNWYKPWGAISFKELKEIK